MAGISHQWLCLALALLCLAAFCLDSAEAGRRNRAGKKAAKGKPCKYRKVKSDCNAATNTRNLTFTLKKGDGEECPQTKVVSASCRKIEGCDYQKKVGQWTDCDPHTNVRSLTKPVVDGAPDNCPQTHIKVRRCNKARKGGKVKASRRKGPGRKNKWKKKDRKNKKKAMRKNKKMRRQERRDRKAAGTVSSE